MHSDRPILNEAVGTMCAAMRHRGPDGIGFLRRPQVELGHVRLSIIDLGGGAQPMSNEDGTVHVVFNGEIYNYPELRPALEGRGHVLRTHCDTEVLVHLYEDHGPDMVDHLLGEFAFAIWDDRNQSLFLARDRLGVKPLYYAEVGGRLIFASEMSALMASGLVPREMDMTAVKTYLATRRIPAPRSIYRAARKLLPGHRMEVRGGQMRVSCYWDVSFEPDGARGEDDFAEEVRALVDDSVRRQLMSDVPLGVFLSGGVDSSSVTSSAVRHTEGLVKTFSIGYREQHYDESRFYKLVAARLGIDHHEFILEPDLAHVLPTLAWHFGEPCAIGSALPLYYLAKMAREFVTVVLSGDGADEVFAGYNVYNYAGWLRSLDRYAGPLLRHPLTGALLDRLPRRTTSVWGRWMRRARNVHQLLKLPESLRMRFMGNLLGLREMLLLNPPAGSEVPEAEEAFCRANARNDWLAPYLYADIKTLLPDEMFTKLDRMTMAHSMEGRVPLVDYRLVELAGRIPSHMKLKRGGVKAIFKKAMKKSLPPEVLSRRKVGFRVPFNEWFRRELKNLAFDLLTDRSFKESGIFCADTVKELLDNHMKAADNHGNDIFALVMFEIWRRDLHEGVFARAIEPATGPVHPPPRSN